MNNMGEQINKILKVSQVILNLFIINTYVILFSILSVGILTPTLIGSGFYEIQKILEYDLSGINKRFFGNCVKNFKVTFKSTFFIGLLSIFIWLSLNVFNEMAFADFNPTFFGVIIAIQLIVLFECINIILVSCIQIAIYGKTEAKIIIRNSALIINSNLIRFILATISLIIVYYAVMYFNILICIAVSLYMVLYYVSINGITQNMIHKNKL